MEGQVSADAISGNRECGVSFEGAGRGHAGGMVPLAQSGEGEGGAGQEELLKVLAGGGERWSAGSCAGLGARLSGCSGPGRGLAGWGVWNAREGEKPRRAPPGRARRAQGGGGARGAGPEGLRAGRKGAGAGPEQAWGRDRRGCEGGAEGSGAGRSAGPDRASAESDCLPAVCCCIRASRSVLVQPLPASPYSRCSGAAAHAPLSAPGCWKAGAGDAHPDPWWSSGAPGRPGAPACSLLPAAFGHEAGQATEKTGGITPMSLYVNPPLLLKSPVFCRSFPICCFRQERVWLTKFLAELSALQESCGTNLFKIPVTCARFSAGFEIHF